jgi:hypothetical protein
VQLETELKIIAPAYFCLLPQSLSNSRFPPMLPCPHFCETILGVESGKLVMLLFLDLSLWMRAKQTLEMARRLRGVAPPTA